MKKELFAGIISVWVLLIFSFNSFAQFAPSTNYNRVIEQMPRVELTTIDNDFNKVQTSIQYIDGLGRPLQTVLHRATPTGTQDILGSTVSYDAFSRPLKNYLPSPSSTGTGTYISNIEGLASTFYNDTITFNRPIYEASAANRVVKNYGVG